MHQRLLQCPFESSTTLAYLGCAFFQGCTFRDHLVEFSDDISSQSSTANQINMNSRSVFDQLVAQKDVICVPAKSSKIKYALFCSQFSSKSNSVAFSHLKIDASPRVLINRSSQYPFVWKTPLNSKKTDFSFRLHSKLFIRLPLCK